MKQILLSFLLLSSHAYAQSEEAPRRVTRPSASTTLKASVGLSGEKIQSDLNKSSTVGLTARFMGEHILLEGLILKVDARAILETGSSQSVYESNSYEPTSRLALSEALIQYRPFDVLNLKAGAIAQSMHENRLFISSGAFMGLAQELTFAPLNTLIAFSAFQGIPDNHNLSQRLGKVEEGEARFFKETVKFEWHPQTFSLRTHLSHWAYSDLSTGVAYESRFLGNTIAGLGKENSRFTNTFKGFEAMAELSTIVYKNYELGVSYLAHQNTEARDKSKDSGYLLSPYTAILYGPGITTLKLLSYRLEADSIPAYYGSLAFGGTNKKGTGIELEWKTLDESFSIQGRFMKNQEIDPSSFQADEDLMMIELRRVYDIF